ncbi:hypothetical protein LCGC14_0552270 [marine sediment metagenome]|uniref:Uncharacterized protein n=1 Tax=marine sediment metagenome TaxID=412755 RepID=A0A0F9RUJ8_9ZZZZ
MKLKGGDRWTDELPPGGVEPVECVRCGYMILSESEGDPLRRLTETTDWEKARKLVPCGLCKHVESCLSYSAVIGCPVFAVAQGLADERAAAWKAGHEEGWVAAKHDATPLIRAVQRMAYEKGKRGEEWEEPPPPQTVESG